jgi:thiamine phosphate synthase YjbQ (UPF0047 family)
MLSRAAPKDIECEHVMLGMMETYTHIGASMIGPILTILFTEGQMMLGTWQ